MKKRSGTLKFRLNDVERDAIDTAGAVLGVGPSTFARMATLRAAGQKPAKPPRGKPNVSARALATWTAELARIGNNLNQCARRLNSGADVELAALQTIRHETQRLREAVLAAHGEQD